jgi:xylulokinase
MHDGHVIFAARRTTKGGRVDEVTIGLDIGTTSVKAVAADAGGAVLAVLRVPHHAGVPGPDRLEHDAAAAWRRGPLAALDRLAADGVPVADAAGIAVAAMVPSLAAVDAGGVPVTPGLLYGDGRGRSVAAGARPGTGDEVMGFLAWTARQAPDAAGLWPAQAVANHALCGTAAVDLATAGAAYPIFDGTAWSAAHLAPHGIDTGLLPAVAPLGGAIGRRGRTVVASGLVDAIGEQLVAGAEAVGDVLVILGSTLLTWAVVPAWRDDPRLLCIPHTTPGSFLQGGPSNAGGLFVDWVRRLLGVQGAPPPTPAAGSVPVWAPYLRGERTPLHDPHRRGALAGLDITQGPGGVLRAAYEATGFVVRHHLQVAGVVPRRLVVTGAASVTRRGCRPWLTAPVRPSTSWPCRRVRRWARRGSPGWPRVLNPRPPPRAGGPAWRTGSSPIPSGTRPSRSATRPSST